jgi:Arc/MetJ-type ribon-helix-helix transcriptional regulator
MNLNVRFSGVVEKILEQAVKEGYAATKTEALRMGVFELNNKYNLLEDIEDVERADSIMARIKAGKERLYSEKQILKELGK